MLVNEETIQQVICSPCVVQPESTPWVVMAPPLRVTLKEASQAGSPRRTMSQGTPNSSVSETAYRELGLAQGACR